MKKGKHLYTAIGGAIGMLLLILDSKTAIAGASEGMDLCIRSVIPSLFPFLTMSCLITGSLHGKRLPLLGGLCRLCGIPAGADPLLVVGLLGGYPAGAQAICQAYQAKKLDRHDAARLLGFCSNAGPAFILGLGMQLFPSVSWAWALWGVHIVSSLLVGILLPGRSKNHAKTGDYPGISLSAAVSGSVKTMSVICGWIVLFRVLLRILRRWVLWLLPDLVQVLLCGALELTNGFLYLSDIADMGIRFILSSCMLSFGGICILLQTVSVTEDLGLGLYFPGKILQTVLSFFLSTVVMMIHEPSGYILTLLSPIVLWSMLLALFLTLFLLKKKKTVAFQKNVVYNKQKFS